jgi:hypothetical protein
VGFFEIVAATALGATVPVVLVRYLDNRVRRRENKAFSESGLGRYMQSVMTSLDRNAGELADKLPPPTNENGESSSDRQSFAEKPL